MLRAWWSVAGRFYWFLWKLSLTGLWDYSVDVNSNLFVCLFSDGELNVLEDILTEAPDQDDELYNPETERDISDKKGTRNNGAGGKVFKLI